MKKVNKLNFLPASLLVIFCVLSSGMTGCSPDSNNEDKILTGNNNAGIILSHGTSLRIDPFIFSHRICDLNKGTTVKIIGKSSEKSWVGKTHHYWYKIRLENNITGWVYGSTIRVITADNRTILKSYLSDFWEEESDKLMKEISGKWWSINRYGDFTRHCVEIYSDGTYKSYYKGNSNIISGVYTFDFNKNEIIFLKGTSFGKNLNYIKRGRSFILHKDLNAGTLRFKRITEDIKPEDENKSNEDKTE